MSYPRRMSMKRNSQRWNVCGRMADKAGPYLTQMQKIRVKQRDPNHGCPIGASLVWVESSFAVVASSGLRCSGAGNIRRSVDAGLDKLFKKRTIQDHGAPQFFGRGFVLS